MTDRNAPCPCGSGKKFKKCCLGKAPAAPGPAPGPAGAARPTRPGRQSGQGPSDEELLRTAERLRGQSKLGDAAKAYEAMLARRPQHAQALFALGLINAQVQKHEAAIEFYRKAGAAKKGWAAPLVARADALLSMGQAADALTCAREAIRIEPGARRSHIVAATCLHRLNRVDDALKVIRQAPHHEADAPELAVVRAELHRRQGGLDDARAVLEACLEEAGGRRNVHQVLKELALVLDKLGAYDEAFESARDGGLAYAATPRAAHIHRDMWFDRIDEYRDLLTGEQLAYWAAETFDDGHPVPAFLVGFPRSGTTMTEQIMAAHPEVTTSDEGPFIQERCEEMRRLTRSETIGQALIRVDRPQVLALRAAYWQSVERMVGGSIEGRVFVDKLPLNIIDVGVVNTLFPEARIIVALRDPRDVCLSCFMQRFGLNAAMVNFLWWERTAAFYAKTMGFWLWVRDLLTVPTITVRYEDTVIDLQTQAQRILELLDLPWDDAVLAFHEKAKTRSLSTPSFAAVTEKVHTRAVGRWHNYEKHYEPVLDHLRPFIDAFGYGADGDEPVRSI